MKNLLRKIVPYQYTPSGYVDHLIRRRSGLVVQSGPFKGMKYINQASGSVFPPKLLGIYELELQPVVLSILQSPPAVFVDIGSAEGYYAVGMARALPKETEVIAFEMDARARRSLQQLADKNGLEDRIQIREKCEPKDLAAVIKPNRKTVVLCDVEGYEDQLLNPDLVPGLRHADILVELHDFIVPAISDTIRARFQGTHSIEIITEKKRSLEHYPYSTPITKILPSKYRLWAVGEHRMVQMHWFWMKPLVA